MDGAINQVVYLESVGFSYFLDSLVWTTMVDCQQQNGRR